MWDQAQLGTTAPMAYNSQQAGPADGASNSILWMGDLEPWMDENYIRQLWMSMGEVVNVKMIRDKISNSNAGYCFVDFMNPAGAAKHLASVNGTTIPGTTRVFKLNWASGGGAAGIMSGGPGMERGPEYSLFVGDLGPDVTDYMLLQAFLPRYLTCKSAKVVTDPATSMSRGYGFVRFSDESEQQRALAEMQGQFCGSRAMRLSLATPKANPGTGIPPTSPNGGAPFAPPPQPAAAPVPPQGYYPPAPVAPHMPSAGGYNQFSDPTNTTIFVGGLNTQISDEELRSYFLPFGEVVYTKIPPGKGCGFVQFVHRQSAEMALAQMNGFLIGGSRVRLSWGRSQAIPKTDYRPVSAGPYGAPSPYSAGGYPHPGGYAQGYAPAPHYPMHPQQPPVQPAPMLRDPRDPVTAERANREFLERRQRVAMEGGIGAGWRAYGVQI
ncbi:hypothetical protein HDU89_006365 [Geranomyces variabilis]|nr:hypothetical protein HDU89_006365 [Geranomyces variabilis]